jgi:hypothetical protein
MNEVVKKKTPPGRITFVTTDAVVLNNHKGGLKVTKGDLVNVP